MRRSTLLVATIALALLMVAAPAQAATFTVNSTNDSRGEKSPGDGRCETINVGGQCTLRDAIVEADALSGDDTIKFASNVRGAISLFRGQLTIGSNLTIDGPGARALSVYADESSRVLSIGGAAEVKIEGLTITEGVGGYVVQDGGGIYKAGGTLTLTNSTVSGNSAEDGGGIYNAGGPLTVNNSTFSGNSATQFGGAISNNGFDTITVTNSTFSGNSADFGGGIYTEKMATFENTIVANSPSGENCHTNGPIVDAGYNIEDGTSCSFSTANKSLPSTNPLLGALANNGGSTMTHALKKGSPALNRIPKGTNGCGTEIKRDQRGVARPQGKKCDTGSFEKQL